MGPWVAAYGDFKTDLAGLVEAAPPEFDEEIANAQAAVDELDALLASGEADSIEARPRLSALHAEFTDAVHRLFESMESACA